MKLFHTTDVKQIDCFTIEREPITSINLMARASFAFAQEALTWLPQDADVAVVAGFGNNGGDAFFVAKYLHMAGVNVQVWHCTGGKPLSADCAEARAQYERQYLNTVQQVTDVNLLPDFSHQWVIDGLFGSGLNRPLEGYFADVIARMNTSKHILAIDIPSGLMGEDNAQNTPQSIVRAQTTITFQFPKLAFFFAENAQYVGAWHVVDIQLDAAAMAQIPSNYYLTDSAEVQQLLHPRITFAHKGTFGHALIMGGSRGKMGAAALATKACLRAGAGLVTAFIPQVGYVIMQTLVPEAMVMESAGTNEITNLPDLTRYNAIGVGIGIGQCDATVQAVRNLLKNISSPMVLDADALNIISLHKDEMLPLIPQNSILTPHPKEFDRLTSSSHTAHERLLKAMTFAQQWHVVVVLKGAYTAVCLPDGTCHFNNTGNPGMATAGSGDVLCGILTGLLAQGYSPAEAAIVGVWYHGLAGDEAAKIHTQTGLIARDLIEALAIEKNK